MSNPPDRSVPSVRDVLHCPAVAKRQPMVAQPFEAGLGGWVRIRLIETWRQRRIRRFRRYATLSTILRSRSDNRW
jgi:hypothetical protein